MRKNEPVTRSSSPGSKRATRRWSRDSEARGRTRFARDRGLFTHLVGVEELAAAQELVDDEVVVGVLLGQALVEVEGGVGNRRHRLANDGGGGGDISGTHLDV